MKLKEFKKTRWYKPTLLRYGLHLKACFDLDCHELIMPFQRFIDEVMDAGITDAVRADMLAITELEPYVAFQRYPAYIEPTKKEQALGFYSEAMGRKMR
jgi:hypothetical protein